MTKHFHVVQQNVLNFIGPFCDNLCSLFVNAVNPFTESVPFDVVIQMMRYDLFNSSKSVTKCTRRVKHLHNVIRVRIRASDVNPFIHVVAAVFVWNDAQIDVARVCVTRIGPTMIHRTNFHNVHHVIMYDFFIQIEIKFFQYLVGFIILRVGVDIGIGILVKRGSAHWTRGHWIRFVPFQQARNAKQVPAHGVSVIGADMQPGSAYAAIANSIII
jgi:hypothetical protein